MTARGPSLALRADGPRDLRVLDGGDAERSIANLEEAVYAVARSGAIPVTLGGR